MCKDINVLTFDHVGHLCYMDYQYIVNPTLRTVADDLDSPRPCLADAPLMTSSCRNNVTVAITQHVLLSIVEKFTLKIL